jgi:hypothetical protein
MGVLAKILRVFIYIAMLILGGVLNYYIDNPITVALIMMSVSFTLNRRKTPQPTISAAPINQSTKITQKVHPNKIYCTNCGSLNNKISRYCTSCGTKLQINDNLMKIDSQRERYSPENILEQIRSLNAYYKSGGIDETSYKNILERSIFLDNWNRRWAVGANSLRWYRYNNGNWISDVPNGTLSIV